MNASTAYTPKQALALDTPEGYDKSGGAITAEYAKHCISRCLPFGADSIILDNACGTGAITDAIIASEPPSSIQLNLADKSPAYTAFCQAKYANIQLSIGTYTMPSEALRIAYGSLTHSFNNFGIFMTTNSGRDGASEIYRTLEPGGIAVTTCWESLTWLGPAKAVHERTRPGAPWPNPVVSWSDGNHLVGILKEAGFSNVELRTEEVWAKTRDLRSWAEQSWAILGGPPTGGWKEGDEEKWDEAVDIFVEELRKADGFKEMDDGEIRMRCSAHIVTAVR
ncbi:hypothetical protein BT63DRAFT_424017 [Microthyrium microscopicum]|uniref:Uncharacterized protein n=1 Tax=Microthyrium microscopicum TaxID=703497 RepID=A0A6A6UG43_9PEZI|nr:hypothetical protein BT63DRAFT_424017 [Microthyrium microscopicum]